MLSRRTRKTVSLAKQAAELAVVVPQVVAHRVARMAIAGPSPSERDRREFHRMSAEKVNAFGDSWNAMALQAFRANQMLAASFIRAFWLPALAGKPPSTATVTHLQDAAMGVLVKGMEPFHRTAVANAKRLSRTKLR